MVDKIMDPNIAARAYGQTSRIPVANIPTQQSGGTSFKDFVEDSIAKSIDTMKTGEKTQARAVTGEADLAEVVQAVTDSELTLQTIVAVRDKLISAYQEIMRMPI
jgi:flagellar hook-basal body complex protein FliE